MDVDTIVTEIILRIKNINPHAAHALGMVFPEPDDIRNAQVYELAAVGNISFKEANKLKTLFDTYDDDSLQSGVIINNCKICGNHSVGSTICSRCTNKKLCGRCGSYIGSEETCSVCGLSKFKENGSSIGQDFIKKWNKSTEEPSSKIIETTLKKYNKLAKQYPNYPQLLEIKGELQEKLNKQDEALESYRKAAKLLEKNKEQLPKELEEKINGNGIHKILKNGISSNELIKTTLKKYNDLAAVYPTSPQIWEIKGELQEKLNKQDEALESYRKAAELLEKNKETLPKSLEEKINGNGKHSTLKSDISKKSKKGLTNGLTNGKINGFINGKSLINGNGLTNGKTNGFINGKINGITNIFRNGMINGNGLINGKGKFGIVIGANKPRIYRGVGVIAILFFLLIIPVLISLLYAPYISISVDGDFGEWENITPYYDLVNDVRSENIDILEYKIISEDDNIYFYILTEDNLFSEKAGLYIFIDGDRDNMTGYKKGDIGAEYLVEIYGWNGHIESHKLMIYNGTRNDDWNGFISHGNAAVTFRGNRIEGSFHSEYRNPRMNIVTTDYAGDFDNTFTIESERDTLMIYSSIDKDVISSLQDVALIMDTTPHNGCSIDGFVFEYAGAVPSSFSIYLDNGNLVYNAVDILISNSFTITGNIITVSGEYGIDGNQTFLAVVSFSSPTQIYFGLRLRDVITDDFVSIDEKIEGYMYIDIIPSQIQIDGAFGDWTSVQFDQNDDVWPEENYTYENIDVREYGVDAISNNLNFYLSVDGRMIGGVDIPVIRERGVVDSDRDTIPDYADILPNDFDNDGENDSMEDGDVDSDGERDLNYGGMDEYLNTTITTENIVDEYESSILGTETSKFISRFLGKIPVSLQTGNDSVQIFIDSDDDINTGYYAPWLGIGADYRIQIYGRDAEILNSSVFMYGGSGWNWVYVDKYTSFIGHSKMEGYVSKSLVNLQTDFRVVYFATNWKNQRDDCLFDNSSNTVVTRAEGNIETKTLHLHGGYSMDTFPGSSTLYVNIGNGNTVQWTQSPNFASDFSLDGNLVVTLYIRRRAWSSSTSTVTLFYGSTTLGAATQTISPSWGYNQYTFVISPSVSDVPVGEAITLSYYNNRRTYIAYDSAGYDSRIDMPTSTYVNIESIETYNGTSGLTQNTFTSGEDVLIRTNVTDPFGSQDISGTDITIYYPNGTTLLSKTAMTLEQTDLSTLSHWNLYNYSLTLSSSAPVGTYTIVCNATESNGVTTEQSFYFYILSTEPAVEIYPDNEGEISAGKTFEYIHVVKNMNSMTSDTFDIIYSSSQGWDIEFYEDDGMTLLTDTDGDSIIDTGDLGPEGSKTIIVKITVPSETPIDTVDSTIITATSSQDTNVSDTAYDNTTVISPPPEGKTLHLHSGNGMDTFPGSSVSYEDVENGGTVDWTQSPAFASDFSLDGNLVVTLYIRRRAWSSSTSTVTLFYGSTTLGAATQTISPSWGYNQYTFVISPSVSDVPVGEAITLSYYNNRRTYIAYDSAGYDSRIDMPTSTYVNIESIDTYNATSGLTQTTFTSGEDILVRTNVTDPFGSQDISGTNITVYYPNGTVLISETSMTLEQTEPSTLSLWNLYNYSLTLPSDAPVGRYTIECEGIESNGVTTIQTAYFYILSGVSIEPDNNSTVTAPVFVNYTHTITNTGSGRDIYNIEVSSSQGFNVTVYADTNGDGIGDIVMGIDYGGDGSWESVTVGYDVDGDGNPDTGYLLPGQTFDIVVQIEIPAGFIGIDNTTILAQSGFSAVWDNAYDETTVIPEFSTIIVPMLVITFLIILRRHMENKNDKKKNKENE